MTPSVVDRHDMPGLPGGSHVCWIVDDDEPYASLAADVVTGGRDAGEKTFVFGPEGSADLAALTPAAAGAADPRMAFLHGGPLEPEVMQETFRRETATALAEGFRGVRIVADMDWLLPLGTTSEEVVEFELLIDGLVDELGAMIVCAYRRSSFEHPTIEGALAVHPIGVCRDDEPPFRFVAGREGSWRLAGEVDFGVGELFEAAFRAAARRRPCLVDVSGLQFIDVAGLRSIARLATGSDERIVLQGASPTLRRVWDLSGFGASATGVELVD